MSKDLGSELFVCVCDRLNLRGGKKERRIVLKITVQLQSSHMLCRFILYFLMHYFLLDWE